jgi:hypothetical protein
MEKVSLLPEVMVLPLVELHLHFIDEKLQNTVPCWRISTK